MTKTLSQKKKSDFVSFSVVRHSFFIGYRHNVSHVISVTPVFVYREFRKTNIKISCNKEDNLAELSPKKKKKQKNRQPKFLTLTNQPLTITITLKTQ